MRARRSHQALVALPAEESYCTTVLFLVGKEAMSHTIAPKPPSSSFHPPFPAVKKKPPQRKASTGAIQALTCPEQSVQFKVNFFSSALIGLRWF